MLDHPRGFESRLVTFDLGADRTLLDLDDPAALAERGLRPSRVVTRDRQMTQAWAAAIHAEGSWAGISWWSYYDPEWRPAGFGARPARGSSPASSWWMSSRSERNTLPSLKLHAHC